MLAESVSSAAVVRYWMEFGRVDQTDEDVRPVRRAAHAGGESPRSTGSGAASRLGALVVAALVLASFLATDAHGSLSLDATRHALTRAGRTLRCGRVATSQSTDHHGDYVYVTDVTASGSDCSTARRIAAGVIARFCYAYYDVGFAGCPYQGAPSIFAGEHVGGWYCRAKDVPSWGAPQLTCVRGRGRIDGALDTGGGD